jgi:urease accessory protein
VGEDRVRVRVDVGPGVAAAVRSVAATVVYAARGAGTRWDTDIRVADGARLDWRPEPVILTGQARHEATTVVHAVPGAEVTIDEVLTLGRAGEPAGTLRSTLAVWRDDAPVLITSSDTSLPGWSGAGGVHGAAIVAYRLRLGDGGRPATGRTTGDVALLEPATGCRLAVATASDVADARRSLDTVLPD